MSALIIFVSTKVVYLILLAAIIFFLTLSRSEKGEMALVSLFSLPIAFVASRLAKLAIDSPRPFVVHQVTPLIPHAPDNGFPSDHVLLTMTVAAIIFTANRTAGAIFTLLAIAVGAARVAAMVHHGLDIAGSVLISVLAVVIGVLLARRYERSLGPLLPRFMRP